MTYPSDLPICLICTEYAHPDSEGRLCEKCTLKEFQGELSEYDEDDKIEFQNQYAALLGEIAVWNDICNMHRQFGEFAWLDYLEILEAERLERMASE